MNFNPLELLKILEPARYHFFAATGAFVLYVLNRNNGVKPFSIFDAVNIDVSDSGRPRDILFDMFLSSSLGSIIIVALTSPNTIPQAIVAGLGMTGLLLPFGKSQNNP